MKSFNAKKLILFSALLGFFMLLNPEMVQANFSANSNVKKNVYSAETVWEYTIHFDANTGSGSMNDIVIHRSNDVFSLPQCGFTKHGYIFKGWENENFNVDCSATDAPIITSPLTYTYGSTVTLQAKWEPIKFTVIYDANGGYGEDVSQDVIWTASGTQDTTLAKVKTFAECGFTKNNHIFVGWSTNSIGPMKDANNNDFYYTEEEQHNYIDDNGLVQNIYGKTPEQLLAEPVITLYAIYDKAYSGSDNEGYYKITGTSQKGGNSTYKHWHLTNKETIGTVSPQVSNSQGENGVKYTGIFYIGDTVNNIEIVKDKEETDKTHVYTSE